MKFNELFTPPQYDPYRREYVYPGGTRVCELKYLREQQYWQAKNKERERKMNAEYRLKCIQATEIMNEMLGGTAPSMIHQRLRARNIL